MEGGQLLFPRVLSLFRWVVDEASSISIFQTLPVQHDFPMDELRKCEAHWLVVLVNYINSPQ